MMGAKDKIHRNTGLESEGDPLSHARTGQVSLWHSGLTFVQVTGGRTEGRGRGGPSTGARGLSAKTRGGGSVGGEAPGEWFALAR